MILNMRHSSRYCKRRSWLTQFGALCLNQPVDGVEVRILHNSHCQAFSGIRGKLPSPCSVFYQKYQAMGTLLGTMFGFVSAVLLTPRSSRGESTGGLPAAPGVVSIALYHVAAARELQPLRSTFINTV